MRCCREVLQEHANELNIIPRGGSLQIVLYNEKRGGGASYSYTVEVLSIQPWPTFHSLLDLRDTENQ